MAIFSVNQGLIFYFLNKGEKLVWAIPRKLKLGYLFFPVWGPKRVEQMFFLEILVVSGRIVVVCGRIVVG